MANVSMVSNPALVTSPNANTDNTLVPISGIYGVDSSGTITAYIEVVTGTFKFNVGATSANSTATYIAGDKFIITFRPGLDMIQFQSANTSETFRISI